MRRILVIFGGCSTEYEVSLQSAAAVAEAIDVSRYEVLYLGISREGEAYYYTGDAEGMIGNIYYYSEVGASGYWNYVDGVATLH